MPRKLVKLTAGRAFEITLQRNLKPERPGTATGITVNQIFEYMRSYGVRGHAWVDNMPVGSRLPVPKSHAIAV